MARAATWAFLALAMSSAPAAGDEPKQMSKATMSAVQLRACQRFCIHRDSACIQATPRPAGCDTDAVLCQSGCVSCVATFDACLNGKDATQDACQVPFIACLKKGFGNRDAGAPLIHFEGGDGQSLKTAVVISGAVNEVEGIVAENVYALRTHPTWLKRDQALIHDQKRSFDVIGYEASDGKHQLWFDITSFFGKM